MGKATPTIKSSSKKTPLFDNHLEVQRDGIGYSASTLEQLEARYRKNLLHQKEKITREVKSVYDSRDKELKSEVDSLRKVLKSEVEQLVEAGHDLHQQTTLATDQQIVNPGRYHVGFLLAVRTTIQKIIKARKSIEESSQWLQIHNQRGKKKGSFWNTFTSNKGGSKFLLSSEHYLTRSAG
jgi:hypothetical protein